MDSLPPQGGSTLLCVDAGTTNTRAWLLAGDRILARREAAVGARDTAREGNSEPLRTCLRGLLGELRRQRPPDVPEPRYVAAAGMITSAQGLVEVPHVAAPAGLAELAAAAQLRWLLDVSELPFLFVPGVRTPARRGEGSWSGDVMRGEETLCLGLLQQGRLRPGGALLSVGSHWKLIRIDEVGRVAESRTSLAGEMVEAVRSQTILASALPAGRLLEPDHALLLEGMAESRRSGLARALFGVRLLELAGGAGEQARLSFLVGAFIGAELDHLQGSGLLSPGTDVTVVGGEKVGGAWALALQRSGCAPSSLSPEQAESGLLAGLRAIAQAHTSSIASP
jgi:2-dehydro-3-deoxygalactonokinase